LVVIFIYLVVVDVFEDPDDLVVTRIFIALVISTRNFYTRKFFRSFILAEQLSEVETSRSDDNTMAAIIGNKTQLQFEI